MPRPIRIERAPAPWHRNRSHDWLWTCNHCNRHRYVTTDSQPAALKQGLAHLATHATEPQR